MNNDGFIPWVFLLDHLLTIAGFLLAVALITQILREQRRPGVTLAWVMAIIFIPYLGVPLYLLFGGRKIRRVVAKKTALPKDGFGADAREVEPQNDTARVLMSAGMPPMRTGNAVKIYDNGEFAYHALMDMLEEAEHSIHITTFILGYDDVGRAIVDKLAEKACKGLEVRLLLDGLGCIKTSRGFVQPLRDAGGKVGVFLPVIPVQRKWSANLRNHRKIVVVDGKAAMLGGMNLGDQFMGPVPSKQRFYDMAIFLRGPAVGDIQEIFTSDWLYATEEHIQYPTKPAPGDHHGTSIVQVVASGPDVPADPLHDAIITSIMDARERVWIVTPYFVPGESIIHALALQARIGRDVRVIVPKRSNHPLTDVARGPALRTLHAAGAKIHSYTEGMIHAKALLFDDTLALTGSPNLDMRSLYYNFENALFHYSTDEIAYTERWMRALLLQCEDYAPKAPSLSRQWAEGLCILASPLL